jgi:hypothetical protein
MRSSEPPLCFSVQCGAVPEKLVCLQRIKFEHSKPEIRLGYYIIGKKPKMRGKRVWGQYCIFMPLRDFKALIRRAEKKG